MRVKVIILVVLLGAFGILAAANINLISESLLSLGDVSGFVQYGNYALFYGGDRDLSILDLSAGASVYPIATFDVPVAEYRCNNVYIWGSNAYLVYPDKIHIVSLANIHNPVLQATFSPSAYYRVLIQNRYLYNISSTGILSSYSLNNPLQPELLDTLDTGMLSSRYLVACNGFLVCQNDSLSIVDTTNPADLVLCGSIAYNDSTPYSSGSPVAAFDKYLYCNEFNEIKVYFLGNPEYPELVGNVTLDCDDLMFQTHIWDGVLWSIYVDHDEESDLAGLMAVDIRMPSAPVQLLKQEMNLWGWDLFWYGKFMIASGNLMYLYQSSDYFTIAEISGGILTENDTCYPRGSISKILANEQRIVGLNQNIQVLDYNQDLSLYLQSQFEPEPQGMDAMQIMDDMLLSSSIAYSDNAPRLTIYDLQSGSKAGSILMPCVAYEQPRTTRDIQRYNNYALVCNGDGGFYCIDVSNPTQPEQKFAISQYSYTSSTASAGELWLANFWDWPGSFGSQISCYDITDISNPVLKCNIENSNASKLLKIGDYLYALRWNQLMCYHLEGDTVVEQSEYYLSAEEGADMLPLGKGLLIGSNTGLKVLSLKDPLHPVEAGDYPFEMVYPDNPWDYPYYPSAFFAVTNTNILVANGLSVRCFDASLAAFLCEDTPELSSGKLFAFPNPAREKISFCFDKGMEGTAVLELYNLRGQKLISKSYTSTAEGLVLNNLALRDGSGLKLAAGVYIVKVKNGSSQQICKIAVLP